MSEDDEITADFDLDEAPTEKKSPRVSEDSSAGPDQEQKRHTSRSGTETISDETTSKVKKLQNVLGLPSTDNAGRSSHKRSRSPSDSESSSETRSVDDYVSPSKIAKIFRNKVSPTNLCQLSAMSRGTPSDVRKIVPDASVQQICQMCEL